MAVWLSEEWAVIGGMMTTEQQVPGKATAAQRCLARGAIIAAGASALVPLLDTPVRCTVRPGTGRG